MKGGRGNNINNYFEILKKLTEKENLEFSYSSVEKIENFYSVRRIYPEAKVVISFGLNYNYDWNNIPVETIGYIPSYTTANFYKILREKIKSIADSLYEVSSKNVSKKNFFAISINDKLNDRLLAFLTGLGFFQKNGLINVKNKGINFVIGFLILFEKIDLPDIFYDSFSYDNFFSSLKDQPIFTEKSIVPEKDVKKIWVANHCKNCNICINSCPTKALSENGLNKNLCLQHLSAIDNLENIDFYINNWKNNFYGCSLCVKSCPFSKNIIKSEKKPEEFKGYIGTYFNPQSINELPLDNMKILFPDNQLSAKWIGETVHLRNLILLLKYQNRFNDILFIKKQIDNLSLSGNSKELIKSILNRIL